MRAGRRSRTAQYAALVRAVLAAKGVVDDPHAAGLLTPVMRWSAAILQRIPRLTDTAFYAGLATRTLYFDRRLERALDRGIAQVVVVGAGYDSRAWRLARLGVGFFEVDHPATQSDKRRRAPSGGPVFVPVDLGEASLVQSLTEASLDWHRPTVFVIEGVTMYLEEDEVRSMLRDLANAAAPDSQLVVNFAAPSGTGEAHDRRRQLLLAVLGRVQGEGFRSARDLRDAAGFVAASGWRVLEATTLHEEAVTLLAQHPRLDRRRINPQAALVVATKGS